MKSALETYWEFIQVKILKFNSNSRSFETISEIPISFDLGKISDILYISSREEVNVTSLIFIRLISVNFFCHTFFVCLDLIELYVHY